MFQNNEENNNGPPKYDAPKPPGPCLEPSPSPKLGASPKPGSSPVVPRAKPVSPHSPVSLSSQQTSEDYALPYANRGALEPPNPCLKPKPPDPSLKPVFIPSLHNAEEEEEGAYYRAWDDKDLYVNQRDKDTDIHTNTNNPFGNLYPNNENNNRTLPPLPAKPANPPSACVFHDQYKNNNNKDNLTHGDNLSGEWKDNDVPEEGAYYRAWDDKDLYVNRSDKDNQVHVKLHDTNDHLEVDQERKPVVLPPVPAKPANPSKACIIHNRSDDLYVKRTDRDDGTQGAVCDSQDETYDNARPIPEKSTKPPWACVKHDTSGNEDVSSDELYVNQGVKDNDVHGERHDLSENLYVNQKRMDAAAIPGELYQNRSAWQERASDVYENQSNRGSIYPPQVGCP